MTLRIAEYDFDGPFLGTDELKNVPGVFAVISALGYMPVLMDVDSSDDVRTAVENHNREDSWRDLAGDTGWAYAVMYTHMQSPGKRQSVVREIRERMDVPCGN